MFWEATHIKPRLTPLPPTLSSPHPWEGKLSVRGGTQPPVLILHSHFRGSGSIKGNKSQLEWGGWGGGGGGRGLGGGRVNRLGGSHTTRILVLAWGRATHRAVCTSTRQFSLTTQKVSKQHFYLFIFLHFFTAAQKSRNSQWKHCTAADRRDRWPWAVPLIKRFYAIFVRFYLKREKDFITTAWMQTPGEKSFRS